MAGNDDKWTGERVERWLKQAAGLERQLQPVADALFGAARLAAGEAVLDVGCGTGPTTRRAAALVGPNGSVTGLDVSAEMLAAAAKIDIAPDGAPVDWVVADAVHWSPSEAAFDVVISRFGVMFFDDPVRAFENLARAAKPGGRLAMVTWARRDQSAIFAVPLYAALRALGRDVPDTADDADAFSLHDRGVIEAVLRPSGWVDVDVTVRDEPLSLGGGLELAAAAEAALRVGPVRHVTEGIAEDARAAVIDAVATELAGHVDDRGHVVLGARIVVTTASR